jgi:hypothetical protein
VEFKNNLLHTDIGDNLMNNNKKIEHVTYGLDFGNNQAALHSTKLDLGFTLKIPVLKQFLMGKPIIIIKQYKIVNNKGTRAEIENEKFKIPGSSVVEQDGKLSLRVPHLHAISEEDKNKDKYVDCEQQKIQLAAGDLIMSEYAHFVPRTAVFSHQSKAQIFLKSTLESFVYELRNVDAKLRLCSERQSGKRMDVYNRIRERDNLVPLDEKGKNEQQDVEDATSIAKYYNLYPELIEYQNTLDNILRESKSEIRAEKMLDTQHMKKKSNDPLNSHRMDKHKYHKCYAIDKRDEMPFLHDSGYIFCRLFIFQLYNLLSKDARSFFKMINTHERADHLPDPIVWIESSQKKKCTNYLNRETYPLNSDGGCIGFYTQTWNSDKSKYEIEEQDPVAFCSILSLLFSCPRFSFENRIVEYNEYVKTANKLDNSEIFDFLGLVKSLRTDDFFNPVPWKNIKSQVLGANGSRSTRSGGLISSNLYQFLLNPYFHSEGLNLLSSSTREDLNINNPVDFKEHAETIRPKGKNPDVFHKHYQEFNNIFKQLRNRMSKLSKELYKACFTILEDKDNMRLLEQAIEIAEHGRENEQVSITLEKIDSLIKNDEPQISLKKQKELIFENTEIS